VPLTVTNGWARGTVSIGEQQTRNWPKVYWPSRKRSPKRLIVLQQPKKWRGTNNNFFPALCAGPVPPTFKFVPAPLVAHTGPAFLGPPCIYYSSLLLFLQSVNKSLNYSLHSRGCHTHTHTHTYSSICTIAAKYSRLICSPAETIPPSGVAIVN